MSSLDKFFEVLNLLSVSSLSFGFQVADTKQKRKKGVFGKQGGDKEVLDSITIMNKDEDVVLASHIYTFVIYYLHVANAFLQLVMDIYITITLLMTFNI